MSEVQPGIATAGPKNRRGDRQSIGHQTGSGPTTGWRIDIAKPLPYTLAGVRYADLVPVDGDRNIALTWQTTEADTIAANIRYFDSEAARWKIFSVMQKAVLPAIGTARLYVIQEARWADLAGTLDVLPIEYMAAPDTWRPAQVLGTPCLPPSAYAMLLYGTLSQGPFGTPSMPFVLPAATSGPALGATLGHVESMAANKNSLYYVNSIDGFIRTIDRATGQITTLAGALTTPSAAEACISPNIVPTAMAGPYFGYLETFLQPSGAGLLLDGDALYYCDTRANAIYYLPATGGPVVFAGIPDTTPRTIDSPSYNGDGHAATATVLSYPTSLAFSPDKKTIYVTDTGDCLILAIPVIAPGIGGTVTTVVGNGHATDTGYTTGVEELTYLRISGDPAHPTMALDYPAGFCGSVTVGKSGRSLYFGQSPFGVACKVDLHTGIITRILGPLVQVINNPAGVVQPIAVEWPDGSTAITLLGTGVQDIALDPCENLIFIDFFRQVRYVAHTGTASATIQTLAGSLSAPTAIQFGEDIPATSKKQGFITRLCAGPPQTYYVAEDDSSYNVPSYNATIGKIHQKGS